MNVGQVVTEERETYPDRCKKSSNGAQDGLDWCDGRDLLREIRGLDG